MGNPRLDGPNKVTNGTFETATTSSWNIVDQAGAVATIDVSTANPLKGSYNLEVDITDVGSGAIDDIHVYQADRTLVISESYSFIFGGRSTAVRSMAVSVILQNSPFTGLDLSTESVTLTTSWQFFEFKFIANTTTNEARLDFQTGVSSDNVHLDDVSLRLALDVKPTYDYRFEENMQRQDIRTKEGGLISYIQGGEFTKFTLPLTWVTSRDRSFVNSWWKSGSDLRFIENTDSPSSFNNVRITGGAEPFSTFVRPYFQQFYAGQVIVETI